MSVVGGEGINLLANTLHRGFGRVRDVRLALCLNTNKKMFQSFDEYTNEAAENGYLKMLKPLLKVIVVGAHRPPQPLERIFHIPLDDFSALA